MKLLTLILTALFAVLAQAQTGWIVGGGGTILKTTNGGTSWVAQTSGVSVDLREIAVVDSENAWVVGNGATLLKTTNGGTTWTSIPASTTGAVSNLWSIAIPAPGKIKIAGTSGSNFRFSNDNGVTWSGPSSGYTTGTGGNTLETRFLDENNGWVVGIFRDIRKTTDGGITWTQQFSNVGSQDLYAVDFSSSQNGWAGGQNQLLFRTTNGGTTWTLFSNSVVTRWQGIDMLDGTDQGWAVGTSSKIYKITGGTTLTQQTSPVTSDFIDVLMQTSTRGWITGTNGTLLKTVDGSTWTQVTTGTTAFLSAIAFAPTEIKSSPSGLLFSTSGTNCNPGSGYTTTKAFDWVSGTVCSVTFGSPQAAVSPGTQYVFNQWEDASTSASRSVTAPGAFTASFTTQHMLTTVANGSGSVTPATGYQNAGLVNVTATPNCSIFTGWTGSTVTGGQINLTAPVTLTANFSAPLSAPAVKGSLQTFRGFANRFRQAVSVRNTTGAAADITIILNGLGSGVSVTAPAAPTGTTTCGTPGSPYYTVASVAPGAYATVTFDFTAPNAASVVYTPTSIVGPGPR